MRRAVRFLLEHAVAALFLDPGLGKTSIVLAAFKVLKKEGMTKGMVVFAPLRPAQTTWPNEVTKWADFSGLDLVVLHGPKKDRMVREDHDIYVVNYEAIPWLWTRVKVGSKWKYMPTDAGRALMERTDILVWDELQNMKHPNTVRFELVKRFIGSFLRRWGLTGSPASNGLMDLFGECYMLDEGKALGQYITHFRTQYFLPLDENGWNWTLRRGADKEIYKAIKPMVLRLDAEDYVTMPRQMEHWLKFDLPKKVRQHYEELEDFLLTNLDAQIVVAANKGSAVNKCRQICSGALYLPGRDPVTGEVLGNGRGRTWELMHNHKIEQLKELVDELQGKQILVAYDYEHDLERLLEAFPGTPYIGGGVSVKKGREAEDQWNAGLIQMLFAQPQSASRGLNLQSSHAHHIVWFTVIWDFEKYDQLNRRLRRQGNNAETLHVYHLIARDTVEESVVYALRRKFKGERELLDALRNKRRVE